MDKARLKSLLYNYEVRLASVVLDGVLNRANKTEVMRKAYKELVRVRLDSLEQNRMWKFAATFYRHCIAAAGRQTDVQKRAEQLYTVLRDDTKILEHQKNEIADSVEFRLKNDKMLEMFRSEAKFFYCTAHAHPAQDHAAYQDRVYYRKNSLLTKEEKRYVKANKLMAIEDVVLGPVYLCTRRNCRHELIPISLETAQIGDFRVEFNPHEISYEESQFNDYRDRLKMLVKMKEVFKSTEGVELPTQMKFDIRRTYSLCRAWKQKIKKAGS